MPTIKRFYKGFDTSRYEDSGGSFEVYDVDCVERDLVREIFTERGSRIKMPHYGTRIPIMTFEINDDEAKSIIREDVKTVCSHDPRVKLLNLDVLSATDKNAIIAIAKINYIEFNVTKDLYLEINNQ